MLKIEADFEKHICSIELHGRSSDVLAEMHASIECFARSFLTKNVHDGGEKLVAMKMAEDFATAVRDAYKQVMEAKKNAD